MNQEINPRFEALLDYLKAARGFDFSGYKRSSLMRRVLKRMQTVGIDDFGQYQDYLEVHPGEFTQLFNTILINVTSFFRDEAAWNYLGGEALPRVLSAKSGEDSIRVWSAGCASGEEVYTLAILLAEALGPDSFHRRVKLYATDVDEEALAAARQAHYGAKALEAVPEKFRAKYFEALADDRHAFRTDLRRSIIFGRHDLVQDAPISRLDLLVCRNTLMYFDAETQGRILARFHFALRDTGHLFLGRAEMLLTHGNLFRPLNLEHRVFVKARRAEPRDRLLTLAQAGNAEAANHLGRQVRLREAAFESGPVAQLIVDANGCLALVNAAARSLLGLNLKDLGRPLQDLEVSYRPLELRPLLEQVYAERRAVRLESVEQQLPAGGVQFLDVQLTPLCANGGTVLGASISFDDVTRSHRLQSDLQRSSQELETAYEELQSAHEELETTNEELQSTNEELETTNEELQSTNEELETMNEELQSTNEELETMNNELRQRGEAVARLNAFLQSILTSLRSAVIAVDRQLKVLAWNRRAEDLWGLRAGEVQGQALLALGIGLPVEQLPLSAFLTGKARHQELTVGATNRRGQAIRCHVTCTAFDGPEGEREGVVLLIEEL